MKTKEEIMLEKLGREIMSKLIDHVLNDAIKKVIAKEMKAGGLLYDRNIHENK